MDSRTDRLKQRPGDQPLPTPGRECVQDALIKAIEERKQLGIARYGQPLMTHTGRDALQDAWEESIDLAAYLTQMRMERGDDSAARARVVAQSWYDATLPNIRTDPAACAVAQALSCVLRAFDGEPSPEALGITPDEPWPWRGGGNE